jgi:hypothetical protein
MTKQALINQMKERQYKRMKELMERKELIRTNFGPEEDD